MSLKMSDFKRLSCTNWKSEKSISSSTQFSISLPFEFRTSRDSKTLSLSQRFKPKIKMAAPLKEDIEGFEEDDDEMPLPHFLKKKDNKVSMGRIIC